MKCVTALQHLRQGGWATRDRFETWWCGVGGVQVETNTSASPGHPSASEKTQTGKKTPASSHGNERLAYSQTPVMSVPLRCFIHV